MCRKKKGTNNSKKANLFSQVLRKKNRKKLIKNSIDGVSRVSVAQIPSEACCYRGTKKPVVTS